MSFHTEISSADYSKFLNSNTLTTLPKRIVPYGGVFSLTMHSPCNAHPPSREIPGSSKKFLGLQRNSWVFKEIAGSSGTAIPPCTIPMVTRITHRDKFLGLQINPWVFWDRYTAMHNPFRNAHHPQREIPGSSKKFLGFQRNCWVFWDRHAQSPW